MDDANDGNWNIFAPIAKLESLDEIDQVWKSSLQISLSWGIFYNSVITSFSSFFNMSIMLHCSFEETDYKSQQLMQIFAFDLKHDLIKIIGCGKLKPEGFTSPSQSSHVHVISSARSHILTSLYFLCIQLSGISHFWFLTKTI